MTSDEIQNILAKPLWKNIDSARHELWLAEIAYQLAVMNERHAEREAEKRYVEGFENGEKLAQRLGSPVGADSDKTLRGLQRIRDLASDLVNLQPYGEVARGLQRIADIADDLGSPVGADSDKTVRGDEMRQLYDSYYIAARDLQDARTLLKTVVEPGELDLLGIRAFLNRTADERTMRPESAG